MNNRAVPVLTMALSAGLGCGRQSLLADDSAAGVPACGARATVIQMPLPGPAPAVDGTAAFQPEHIITGPDGNLWMTEVWARVIGRLTLDGRHDQFLAAGDPPDLTRQLEGIAAGPDGNVWFAEPGTTESLIARITPDGVITKFSLSPNPLGSPRWPTGITAGPDGDIWFGDPNANLIGSMSIDGTLRSNTVFPTPTLWLDVPSTLQVGTDGDFWFGEGSRLGRLTPRGDLTYFPLPEFNGSPSGGGLLLADPDGSFWANGPLGAVRRITPPGPGASELQIDDLFPPDYNDGTGLGVGALALGPDGNLWYTAGASVGCFTPAGRFHQIALPLPGYADDITLGPDGALWFTETMFDRVGRISLN